MKKQLRPKIKKYKYDSKGNLKEILKYENCNSQQRLISRLENTAINSRGQILESKTNVTVNNEQKALIQRNVYDELGNKTSVLSGYENVQSIRNINGRYSFIFNNFYVPL